MTAGPMTDEKPQPARGPRPAAMLLLLALSGCGSDCSLLSSNNGIGCDAATVGLAVVALPVIGVQGIAEDADAGAAFRQMSKR